jgi:hypothetical protein
LPSEPEIIECYRRRESSAEGASVGLDPAGASIRRAEDITEALRGTESGPVPSAN